MKRFCINTNMPPPMNFEAYRECNATLPKAAKSVAITSTNDAATEVKIENPDSMCAVLYDGTW